MPKIPHNNMKASPQARIPARSLCLCTGAVVGAGLGYLWGLGEKKQDPGAVRRYLLIGLIVGAILGALCSDEGAQEVDEGCLGKDASIGKCAAAVGSVGHDVSKNVIGIATTVRQVQNLAGATILA